MLFLLANAAFSAQRGIATLGGHDFLTRPGRLRPQQPLPDMGLKGFPGGGYQAMIVL